MLHGSGIASGAHSTTGCSDDQPRMREFSDRWWMNLLRNQFHRKLGGLTTDFFTALIDRSEWDAQEVGVGEIAAAYNGNILRDAQSRIQDRAHGAERRWVIEAEDAVRASSALQQLACGFVTAGFAAVIAGVSKRENMAG